MNQQNHNFQNEAFRDLFATITANMPSLTFFGIILTYGITAALSVYFLPIPLAISIPAALAVQFGRFAVVFTDFLNPVGPASKWPPIVATFATVVALVEYAYSVNDMQIESAWTDARYWSVYLFGSMLIVFGYILELNFINKGAQGYGMRMLKRNISLDVTPQSRPIAPQRNAQPALVTAEKKRPEIMQELRERQEAQQSHEQSQNPVTTNVYGDAVEVAARLKIAQRDLRSYKSKRLNSIGKPETNQYHIERLQAQIEALKEQLRS